MDIGVHLPEGKFKRLVLLVELGTWVKERTAEIERKDLKRENELIDYLLGVAVDGGMTDIAERGKDGRPVLSKALEEEARRIMDLFGEDEMWGRLETMLGERDFYRFASDKEFAEIEKNEGLLPERAHWYYEKYAREFDAHGVDRLVIDGDMDWK